MTTIDATIRMPEGTHLAYTIYHESEWWGDRDLGHRPNDGRPCVQIHASANHGGGAKWEFGIVEHDHGHPALKLGIFDEGWEAFACMAPFFAALASGEVKTLRDVVGLLDSLGAVDETERAES